jgi:hypothetical protein
VPDEPIPGEGLPGTQENPLPDEVALAGGGDESPEGPDSAGQAGDDEGLPEEPEASSESVDELVDSGQYFEAEVVDGVENAPLADEGERIFHERPVTEGENVPEEEEPGEQR